MPKRKHEEIVENDSEHSDSDNDKFDFEDEVAFDDSEEESGEESQGDSGSELDDDDEFDDDEITGKGLFRVVWILPARSCDILIPVDDVHHREQTEQSKETKQRSIFWCNDQDSCKSIEGNG